MMRDTFDKFAPPERGRFGDNEHRPAGSRPRVTGASDLKDFILVKRAETDKAIGVSESKDRDAKVIFLPKSQVEFEPKAGGHVRVTMPEWLAIEKGLV